MPNKNIIREGVDMERQSSRQEVVSARRGVMALSPLLFFLLFYLGSSILLRDFYAVSITVAFCLTAIYAMVLPDGLSLERRLETFARGAGDSNVLLMIWVFILAGIFSSVAQAIGAIDATVGLLLSLLPSRVMYAGLFVVSCFISFALGSSVGTIAALVPIASGMATEMGGGAGLITAIIVGGAFFGDNLSFISDTTIAATRTIGVRMRDKFRANILIALPAALVTAVLYLLLGQDVPEVALSTTGSWYLMLPYLAVILLAVSGVNVLVSLTAGILLSVLVGLGTGTIAPVEVMAKAGEGISGMSDLIIVTLLAGGLLELIRQRGGIDFIVERLTRRVSGKRSGELSFAALVGLANGCTANNTIAILTTGGIVRDLGERLGIDPRRTASILDITSCIVQSVLPYGAQMLIASGLTGLSVTEILPYMYYPMILSGMLLLSILLRFPYPVRTSVLPLEA
ncbi:Na+/H+ antiporter NhaC family protein [uncultured Porphyromonas sp.]|uniref:Na+/H+ antiporter NhaC family protein n=1 Tax=uncultured Porphyromonas sp. TaxID=159274 RepID=UPI0027DC5A89|nr:Na+/H+ antiporter NhaC family protein [uncultured Porphyromonas sp.]